MLEAAEAVVGAVETKEHTREIVYHDWDWQNKIKGHQRRVLAPGLLNHAVRMECTHEWEMWEVCDSHVFWGSAEEGKEQTREPAGGCWGSILSHKEVGASQGGHRPLTCVLFGKARAGFHPNVLL